MDYLSAVPLSDERGPYLLELTNKVGPCGTCRKMTTFFISRNGKSECVECDTVRGVSAMAKGA